jgi:hypothetical protein
MHFEHRNEPILSRRLFMRRLARHGFYSLLLLAVSLMLGIGGYHWIARFSWIDSLLNASMLLGGMGPVGELPGDDSKVFASIYALYSGVVFLVLAGLLLAPVFHRVLHRFHWEADHQRQGK